MDRKRLLVSSMSPEDLVRAIFFAREPALMCLSETGRWSRGREITTGGRQDETRASIGAVFKHFDKCVEKATTSFAIGNSPTMPTRCCALTWDPR